MLMPLPQGFLQFAPHNPAVVRVLQGAAAPAAKEYSSPRPTPKGYSGAPGAARLVANSSSSIAFKPHHA